MQAFRHVVFRDKVFSRHIRYAIFRDELFFGILNFQIFFLRFLNYNYWISDYESNAIFQI